MKTFQTFLPIFGLIAAVCAVNWNGTVVYTTIVTDIYTTYCPEATTFVQNGVTYTATAHETLTITNCPCTLVKPLYKPSFGFPPKPAPSNGVVPPPSNGSLCITTTEIVSTLITYCPVPTTFVQANITYTVSTPTTLTITNCPCTSVKTLPATLSTVTVSTLTTYCPAPTTITYSGITYPVTAPGTVAIPIVSVATVPVPTLPPAPAPTYVAPTLTAPGPIQVTGNAAMKLDAGFGAAAAAGIAMMLI